MPATAFSQIGQIASMRRVHEAFQWLHLHEPQIMRWQVELVAIPAPPFGEQARAAWLLERFADLGLADAQLDRAGNALATLPGRSASPIGDRDASLSTSKALPVGSQSGTRLGAINTVAREASGEPDSDNPVELAPPSFDSSACRRPLVVLSAHIDTVFSVETPIEPLLEGNRLTAPGACDNGAGVVGLLALASALLRSGLEPDVDILFAANVGEEGEGDLRGMRYLYADPRWRDRIVAHVVLDGAGHEVAVTSALGSRRFEVTIEGSGGHSWTDAGRPNPIATLSEAIAAMNRSHLNAGWPQTGLETGVMAASGKDAAQAFEPSFGSGLPGERFGSRALLSAQGSCEAPMKSEGIKGPLPRSTWNVGTIEGGGSVNSIPEQARARFDLRSTDPAQLVRLEVQLHRAIEDAVLSANAAAEAHHIHDRALRFSMETIGHRPAGALPANARMLNLLRAVDRHLNLRTECRTASTDANIPLSLGVEAISIGAGGDGGGIHTRGEWYDARGRDFGLRRVLLLLLAVASQVELAIAAD